MIPAKTRSATTTTGTTTAIAVLPPVESPFCVAPSWVTGPAVLVLEDPRVVAVEARPPLPVVAAGPSRVTTEVTTIGVSVSPSRLADGVMVVTDVTISVVDGG